MVTRGIHILRQVVLRLLMLTFFTIVTTSLLLRRLSPPLLLLAMPASVQPLHRCLRPPTSNTWLQSTCMPPSHQIAVCRWPRPPFLTCVSINSNSSNSSILLASRYPLPTPRGKPICKLLRRPRLRKGQQPPAASAESVSFAATAANPVDSANGETLNVSIHQYCKPKVVRERIRIRIRIPHP